YWTGYKAEDWFDNPRRIKRARKLLERIVANATAVSVVNPAIAEYLGAGEVIYNSYDPERAKLWRCPTAADKLQIGILGTLDELRPVEPLFKLLATMRENAPAVFEKISLCQIGAINIAEFDTLVDRYGLRDRITVHGTLGRIETIERLSECAMLYIGLSTSKETDIIPGRIFDMIASGRTLLAYAPPDSMIADLVNETNNGHCFHADNMSSAVEYLLSRYQFFSEGKLAVKPLPDYACKFSAEGMAGQFAGLIEKVSGVN
ncbi:MAG: hypothetical protein KAU36_01165, partial [candidate division Zixibacteria bacterium]|nr:hypothetical protein [candidate division Zixibacteria bacterium]